MFTPLIIRVLHHMIDRAKRTNVEKQNVHSWHPYYAGYSEKFVESVLKYEGMEPGKKILDPWLGSGTTGVVCQRFGVDAIGVDINLCMAIFSAAKSSEALNYISVNGEKHLNSIIASASKSRKKHDVSLFAEFSSAGLARKVINILIAIENEFKSIVLTSERISPIQSFFISVLLVSNRQLLGYKTGSNPTWFNKTKPDQCHDFNKVIDTIRKNFYKMLNDLRISLGDSKASFDVYLGSSNKLPLNDNSIDLIITSPPYLTRIDYAVSTQVELLTLLRSEKLYAEVRKATIGTTTIISQQKEPKFEWGELCCNVVESIRNHYSYSSQDYYIKNKVQYFNSVYQSLGELYRVLKEGHNAYLVIQNSYYKEIDIPLPEIYMEMAFNLGFKHCELIRKDVLRSSISFINSRSKKYEKNKIYYEGIIRISK